MAHVTRNGAPATETRSGPPSRRARLRLSEIDPIRSAVRRGELTQVRRLTLGGNEAMAKAALDAGARFFAGYPITPSSEVLEYVARHIFKVGGSYLQMEDEIASIAAAIGASLGGVKAFTATSGPGFSLKQENLGYACITEAPLVVINVQRGGPSTGGPTDVGQSDVMQARWGTHGDHPIVVLAPYSVQECYEETVRAFNLAEALRVPVIVLTDAKVSQMKEPLVLPPVDELPVVGRAHPTGAVGAYEPFGLSPDGVPPLSPFGAGYRAHFTGLYHGRDGLPTKDPKVIAEQLLRLQGKLETPAARALITKTEAFLMEDAEVVVVAFGITARAAKDAVVRARHAGVKAGLVRPVTLWPADDEALSRAFDRARRVVVPELNLGQYVLEVERQAYQWARRAQRVPPEIRPMHRVDTLLISPEEILKELVP
ncbi:MAG: 2-oxoacid:acceptor oxidoreductase subunit alpha [Deltaproteobacteria bacterium]|nr:2-oxoacid:acceptor oxidoreductase subunit alpha [Deltaproteobacteria bacterium]